MQQHGVRCAGLFRAVRLMRHSSCMYVCIYVCMYIRVYVCIYAMNVHNDVLVLSSCASDAALELLCVCVCACVCCVIYIERELYIQRERESCAPEAALELLGAHTELELLGPSIVSLNTNKSSSSSSPWVLTRHANLHQLPPRHACAQETRCVHK